MWDRAAEMNERSVEGGGRARRPQGPRASTSEDSHALLWLDYSYLQQGRQQEARKPSSNQIEEAAAKSGSGRACAATWRSRARRGWWRRASGPRPGAPVNPEGLGADRRLPPTSSPSAWPAFSSGNRAGRQRRAAAHGDACRRRRSSAAKRDDGRAEAPAGRPGSARPASRPFRHPRPAMPTEPASPRSGLGAADRPCRRRQRREARGGHHGAAARGGADLRRGPARGSDRAWPGRRRRSRKSLASSSARRCRSSPAHEFVATC